MHLPLNVLAAGGVLEQSENLIVSVKSVALLGLTTAVIVGVLVVGVSKHFSAKSMAGIVASGALAIWGANSGVQSLSDGFTKEMDQLKKEPAATADKVPGGSKTYREDQ